MIRYLLFDQMNQCTEESVAELMGVVIPQRREEVSRVRPLQRRFGMLKSFQMLQNLLPDLDWERITFRRAEHGKPYLCDARGVRLEGVHFNLSHSAGGVLVAVADEPIGVDIETFRSPSAALLRRCMNDEERGRIEHSGAPLQTFAELWTRKEAVGKCRGTGLTDDMPNTLNGPEQVETHCDPAKGYAYSFAWVGAPPMAV